MAKPGNNYNYMQRYMMAYSTRLEDALERIVRDEDTKQARMIAAAALGLEIEPAPALVPEDDIVAKWISADDVHPPETSMVLAWLKPEHGSGPELIVGANEPGVYWSYSLREHVPIEHISHWQFIYPPNLTNLNRAEEPAFDGDDGEEHELAY